MEEIHSVAPNMLDGGIRQHLAKFIFSGDDVYKKVDMLSGGERGRLALAKLALYDTNLLLLDEPTNHLDITSQEILEEVLDAYNGTILLVSHDRYLIDEVATQIWEIDPETSRLTIFKGTYSELRALRESAIQDARIAALNKQAESSGKGPVSHAPTKQAKAKSDKEERRKKAQLQELENKIAALETSIAEITRQLEISASDTFEVIKLSREYESLHKEMNIKIAEWEGLQE
jgi:ATP-binding cassette subfamily F protein 3